MADSTYYIPGVSIGDQQAGGYATREDMLQAATAKGVDVSGILEQYKAPISTISNRYANPNAFANPVSDFGNQTAYTYEAADGENKRSVAFTGQNSDYSPTPFAAYSPAPLNFEPEKSAFKIQTVTAADYSEAKQMIYDEPSMASYNLPSFLPREPSTLVSTDEPLYTGELMAPFVVTPTSYLPVLILAALGFYLWKHR